MRHPLNAEEISFLLNKPLVAPGVSDAPEDAAVFEDTIQMEIKKDKRLTLWLRLLESLLSFFPKSASGFAVFLLVVAIAPAFGARLFTYLAGYKISLAFSLATALAGALVVLRYGRRWLGECVQALQQGHAPSHEALRNAIVTMGGVLLLLPGPVVNILACFLLLPPVTKLTAVFTARKIRALMR